MASEQEETRNSGRFQKGASGNPGGRPRIEARVRAAAQKKGPAAIKELASLMKDDNKFVRIKACIAVLDRGFGKPAQAFELPPGSTLPALIRIEFVEQPTLVGNGHALEFLG